MVLDNPAIGERADEFVAAFVKGIEEHRFERLQMLYLGRSDERPG